MKKIIISNIKWFIVIMLTSFVAWYSLFSQLSKPKNYEKLQLFITADAINSDEIKEKINKDNLFKDVQITHLNEEDTYYSIVLETSGILSSDMLIVKEDLILTPGATSSFIKLEQDYLFSYDIDLNDYELVKVDNIAYGVVIYDQNKNIDLFNGLITYNQTHQNNRYCLCLNNVSYHVDKYSNQNKNISDKAFKTLYDLLHI